MTDYWYKRPAHFKNDRRVKLLKAKGGFNAIGKFYELIDELFFFPNHKAPHEEMCGVSVGLGIPDAELLLLVGFLKTLGLLEEDDKGIWSPDLLKWRCKGIAASRREQNKRTGEGEEVSPPVPQEDHKESTEESQVGAQPSSSISSSRSSSLISLKGGAGEIFLSGPNKIINLDEETFKALLINHYHGKEEVLREDIEACDDSNHKRDLSRGPLSVSQSASAIRGWLKTKARFAPPRLAQGEHKGSTNGAQRRSQNLVNADATVDVVRQIIEEEQAKL